MRLANYRFSQQIWIIIVGILLLRIGTTISVPFLSIYLHYKVGIGLPMTGFIVGISYLSYVAGGVFGGILSDKYGRRKIFALSLAFYALTFFGFGIATLLTQFPLLITYIFCLLNLIGGLFRIWSETLGQTMLSDLANDTQKIAVFSCRYTTVNVGSAIGPALGAILGFSGTMIGFFITGFFCFVYFLLFIFISRKVPNNVGAKISNIAFPEITKILFKDKALVYFILGGIFAFLVYVQQESTLGQILMQRFNNANLFATLLTLNAIVVICLQIPLTNYCLQGKSPLSVMKIGCIFICIGLCGAAFAGIHYVVYIISQIIFTLGEMLIFPLGGIFIDNIAPIKLRGTYFGATGLQYLGKAVGPLLGGFFLQVTNDTITLSIFAVLSLVTMFFYHRGNQAAIKLIKLPSSDNRILETKQDPIENFG